MIVVDASIFVARLLNEQLGPAQDSVWEILTSQAALVPAHWPNEVANALRRGVRRKRIAASEIGSLMTLLDAFDVRIAEPPKIAHIAALVEQSLATDLSVYDLHYLRLAQVEGVPLATLDNGMRRAAAKAGLALLPVSS